MLDTRPERGCERLTASVVIPTYNRPDRLRQCLHHLALQTVHPEQIVVVDSSEDDRTYDVVKGEFPEVVYLRNPGGRGKTPESRNMGLERVTTDVVAFLDDDANARPDWLQQVLNRYDDPGIGGVGGSALNGIDDERTAGIGSIGLLLPDGRLTGNFAADPGRDVDVDHLLGANMSFRRDALLAIGGIHGHYPGTCLREETDIALRVGRLGNRLVYSPDAIVDHVPGTYAKGTRFDRRYTFYGNRNHIVLLARIFGPTAPILGAYVLTAAMEMSTEMQRALRAAYEFRRTGVQAAARGVGGGLSRMAAVGAGVAVGFPAALRARRTDRRADQVVRQ